MSEQEPTVQPPVVTGQRVRALIVRIVDVLMDVGEPDLQTLPDEYPVCIRARYLKALGLMTEEMFPGLLAGVRQLQVEAKEENS